MTKDRVPLLEQISYGLGSFGTNLQFGMVSAFLMYFYTDVSGVSAAMVAEVFLVSRIVDAVYDPVLGLLIDKTSTRFGKHRPYLIALAIPYAICGAALFTTPALSGSSKTAYIYITYTLFGVLYSSLSLPLLSMLSTLTRDSGQRALINSVREFLGSTAIVGASYITLPLVALLGLGSAAAGFARTAAMFGVVTLIGLALLVANTRERVVPARSVQLSTRQSVRAVVANWPWVSTALINFFFWTGFTVHIQSAIYFTHNLLGRMALLPTLMLTMIAALPGTAIAGSLSNWMGKRPTGLLAATVAMLATAATGWSTDSSWLLGCSALAYLGLGVQAGLIFSMMADSVDYGEWRSGYRAQGFLFAASSFGVKFGMGLGGALGAWMLARGGYVAGGALTPRVAAAINWGYVWAPVACFIAMALSNLAFNFDPAKHTVVVKEASTSHAH
jgi:sugar (glycoside-pentoside-hexuronide) transporter